jgi:TonB family protein
LVIDFPLRPGRVNALGEFLADQFSNALAQESSPGAIVDRKRLRDYLRASGVSPSDLADRDIALWIAGEVGANAIVAGSVSASQKELILSIELIRIGDAKKLASSKIEVPLNDHLSELLVRPLDWPAPPNVAVACTSYSSRDEISELFKALGVTQPTCIHCPPPQYTDDARRARAQAGLKFDVVIDEQGHVAHISVAEGDKYGLTAQAMREIQKWQFKPATKDGKPVTVCMLVEVSFRLF